MGGFGEGAKGSWVERLAGFGMREVYRGREDGALLFQHVAARNAHGEAR